MVYLLQGTRSADTIRGGAGDDSIVGNGGADSLAGGAGNDIFAFATQADFASAILVDGGAGMDIIRIAANVSGLLNLSRVSQIESLVLAGTGVQSLTLLAGAENAFTGGIINISTPSASGLVLNAGAIGGTGGINVTGTSKADVVIGSGGNDTITGKGGADALLGGTGDDRFVLSGAAELTAAALLDGGEGADTLRFTGNLGGTLTLGNVTGLEAMELAGTGSQYVILAAGAENAFTDKVVTISAASASALSLTATALSAGSQVIVTGSAGKDLINASAGDDLITGNGNADRIFGNAGNDAIAFDSLQSVQAVASADGGTGTDTLRITGAVNGTLDRGALSNFEAIELTGSGDLSLTLTSVLSRAFTGGAISLTANNAQSLVLDAGALARGTALTASGGAGDDRFVAGAGSDIFTGGAGNDQFAFGAGDGADVITDFQVHTQAEPVVTTITFDEYGYIYNEYVYSGYQGFNWSNAYVTSENYNGNFSYLSTSGLNAASIGWYDYGYYYSSASATMSRDTPFDLTSVDIAGLYTYSHGWGSYITVTGYDAFGNQVASAGYNVSNWPNHLDLGSDFQNLSSVTFTKSYGMAGFDTIAVRDSGPTGDIARDKLVFAGYSQAQIEQMIADAGEINGDTYLFYNGGQDQVVLKGVQVSQISLADFAWG